MKRFLCVGLIVALSASPSFAKEGAHKHAGKDAGTDNAACHHPPVPKEAKAPSGGKAIHRGAKLSGLPAVSLPELLKSPQKYEGKSVSVTATVRKACERKGCWMELASSKGAKGPGVRVTFKDYGFFVPLDSAGSRAVVEGKVQVRTLSEERAKHYESEGATVPRGKDGKATEVQMVATGVLLH